MSQRQHLIGRKAFQLKVLTGRHLFEKYLFLQTDDAFRIGSVGKDRLFHFGAEICRGRWDPAIQAAVIIRAVIDVVDSLVLEIHCPQQLKCDRTRYIYIVSICKQRAFKTSRYNSCTF